MNLEHPEQWDFERAEERPPVKRGRSVVSVAFPGDDFRAVCEAAARRGMTVSAFIRDATLNRAHKTHVIYSITCSAEAGVLARRFLNVTQ